MAKAAKSTLILIRKSASELLKPLALQMIALPTIAALSDRLF